MWLPSTVDRTERNTIHRGGIKMVLITEAQEGINFMIEMASQGKAKK